MSSLPSPCPSLLPLFLSSAPLLSSIFPFISFHELISCIPITSKHWYHLLQQPSFWKMCKYKHIIITIVPPKQFWNSSLLSALSVSVTSLHINIPPDITAVNIVNSIMFFDSESSSSSQLAMFDSITRVFLLPYYIAHSSLASTLQSLSFAGTFSPSLWQSVAILYTSIRLPITPDYQNRYRTKWSMANAQQLIYFLFEPILLYCHSLTSIDSDHAVFDLESLSVEDIIHYPALHTLTHLRASNIYHGSKLYYTTFNHIDFSPHHPQQHDAFGNIIHDFHTRLDCMYPSQEFPIVTSISGSMMMAQLLSSSSLSSSSSSVPWKSPRSSPLSSSLLTLNLSNCFFSLYHLACVLSHVPSLHTIILTSSSQASIYVNDHYTPPDERYVLGLNEITMVIQKIRPDIQIQVRHHQR